MLCTITGHRPQSFPFGFDEAAPACLALKAQIKKELSALIDSGVDSFMTGMALGVDTWAAEMIIELRKNHTGIRLYAAVPCPGQDAKWSEPQRSRYASVLDACDRRFMLSDRYTPSCMLERDRFMVEHANVVLAVWNGKPTGGTAFTVDYARRSGKRIIIIDAPR